MYRAADVCVVSSLHDGMNLVAKEFIASRTDEHGVLVLSEFTGAARELEHAVHVNPFAVDAFADALHSVAVDVARGAAAAHARAARAGRLAHGVRLGQRAADWPPCRMESELDAVERRIAAAAAPSRRDRQRPRAGAGRSRHQHRLAVPAALRQSVGVRAAARSGARRHLGVQAGRATGSRPPRYVRNTNVLRTEIETADGAFEIFDFAPRILQGLKVDAPIEICRLLRPLSGIAARPRAFRSAARITRAPTSRSSPSGQGLEVVGGPTRLYLSHQRPGAVHAGRQRDPDRSPDLLLR